MENKIVSKKIIWIAGLSCMLLIVFSVLYFAGTIQQSDIQKITALIGLMTENSRTGIAGSPAAQVALNNINRTDNQFASNAPKDGLQNSQNPEDQAVAASQTPKVLFDISAQPLFEKINKTNIFLWLIFVAVIFLFLVYLTYRIYKKRKLKKIKMISRAG